MLGTLISFQVVIGDLAPTLINSVFAVPVSTTCILEQCENHSFDYYEDIK